MIFSGILVGVGTLSVIVAIFFYLGLCVARADAGKHAKIHGFLLVIIPSTMLAVLCYVLSFLVAFLA